MTVQTHDDFRELARVEVPKPGSIGPALRAIRDRFGNSTMRAKLAQVVNELYGNIGEYNSPNDGEIVIYSDSTTGIVRIIATARSPREALMRLKNDLETLSPGFPLAPPLHDRLAVRDNENRHRGRGLYWIANWARLSDRGMPIEIKFDEHESDPVNYSLFVEYHPEDIRGSGSGD